MISDRAIEVARESLAELKGAASSENYAKVLHCSNRLKNFIDLVERKQKELEDDGK